MNDALETCSACLGYEPGFCGLCGTAGEVTPDMNEWYRGYKNGSNAYPASDNVPRPKEPDKFIPSWERDDV